MAGACGAVSSGMMSGRSAPATSSSCTSIPSKCAAPCVTPLKSKFPSSVSTPGSDFAGSCRCIMGSPDERSKTKSCSGGDRSAGGSCTGGTVAAGGAWAGGARGAGETGRTGGTAGAGGAAGTGAGAAAAGATFRFVLASASAASSFIGSTLTSLPSHSTASSNRPPRSAISASIFSARTFSESRAKTLRNASIAAGSFFWSMRQRP